MLAVPEDLDMPQATAPGGLAAPTMVLTGQEGAVLAVDFSPDGRSIATCGASKSILAYNAFGRCENYQVLRGHELAILDLCWTADSERLISVSADASCAFWDVREGKRIKKFIGHQGIVNACATSRRGTPLALTGGDDGSARLWDLRIRKNVRKFQRSFPVLAVDLDDCGERAFIGGLDGVVRMMDLRMDQETMTLRGHADSITGLRISHDDRFLLSNGMDSVVRQWDVRPGFQGTDAERCVQLFTGAKHSFEKCLQRVDWSPDDKLVAAGSADRNVPVWETTKHFSPDEFRMEGAEAKLVSCAPTWWLPGHAGTITDVAFHPQEPLLASAGVDHCVYLGELSCQ